jgi:hypothetical protein
LRKENIAVTEMEYQKTVLTYDEQRNLQQVTSQPYWVVEGTKTSVSNWEVSGSSATHAIYFITAMTGNFYVSYPDLYPTHLIMPTTVTTSTTDSSFSTVVPTAGAVSYAFFPSIPMSPSDFENDRQTFLAMKGSLLENPIYREKFVAILDGQIVDHGDDIGQVAKRVYKKFGYRPVYVDKVAAETETFENSSPE